MAKIIGSDMNGITQTSLAALINLHTKGEVLREVRIYSSSTIDTICEFEFEGNKVYEASGFSVGYGGEGPRGLWTAIRTFWPDKVPADFNKTPIAGMTAGHWKWTPDDKFTTF